MWHIVNYRVAAIRGLSSFHQNSQMIVIAAAGRTISNISPKYLISTPHIKLATD